MRHNPEQSSKPPAKRATRNHLGAFAERLVAGYLAERGYDVIRRNVRLKTGEIDLVALKDGQTVLVEVRARRGHDLDAALSSLSTTKVRRMLSAANEFLALNPELPQEARIDFVAVALGPSGRVERIDLVENAVEG